MKRTVAIFLTVALSVATAVPVLGTRMLCGPSMRAMGSMATATPEPAANCGACSDLAESADGTTLEAGSCCRVAPLDDGNALTATLSSGAAASSNEGRALAPAALPAPATHDVATLASIRSHPGSPPTVSPPRPTQTTILRN